MAYTKNTWNTGDIVSSQKLNHMEDGIADASAMMVISVTLDEQTETETLGKTWQEIYDAMAHGKLCVRKLDTGNINDGIYNHIVSAIYFSDIEGTYKVEIGKSAYSATSADGYPSASTSGGVS